MAEILDCPFKIRDTRYAGSGQAMDGKDIGEKLTGSQPHYFYQTYQNVQ
jgi:hypothetical protein